MKDLLHTLKIAAPIVQRENPKVTVDFTAGDTLGRSPTKLGSYLTKIRPHVVALTTQLAAYYEGQDPVKLLDDAKKQLETTDANKTVTIAMLPLDTVEIYETKGRALELIEDMNRVGRIKYHKQAEIAAQFNKDLILQGRRSRASGAEDEEDEDTDKVATSPSEPKPA